MWVILIFDAVAAMFVGLAEAVGDRWTVTLRRSRPAWPTKAFTVNRSLGFFPVVPLDPASSPPASSPGPARPLRLYLLAAVVGIALTGGVVVFWLWGNSPPKAAGIVVGSFRGDFQRSTPKAGWRYLWNALGDLGTPANYSELQWRDTPEPMYAPDAQGPYPNPPPASYLRVTAEGGHPGHGPGRTRLPYEYYVIYAFTVPERGTYRLSNTSLARVNGGKSGTVHVRVFVNDAETGPDVVCRSAEGIPFHRDLGALVAGNTVYVAVGAGEADGEDRFTIDFTIMR